MEWIVERYNWGEFKGKITNYRRVCDLMMVLLFILLYIFLKTSEIPPLNIQFSQKYRDLDISRIAPERVKIIKKREVPMPSTQQNDGSPAQAELTEIVDADLLNRDVTSVLNQHPNRNLQSVPERTNIRPFESPTMPNDLASLQLQRSPDILQDNATQLLPNIVVEPTQVGQTIAINDKDSQLKTTGKRRTYPNHSGNPFANDKQTAETGQINIPSITSRSQPKNAADISVIIDDLMEWMKKHPSTFIPVVRSFMMHEAGDLTSRVNFSYKERRFEIYLLYKPSRREIRVCLVEGNQSTMLIDSGFKKQINYLRTGAISRSNNREIFAFSTSQMQATEEKTMEFYQVFLAWWDQAKSNK